MKPNEGTVRPRRGQICESGVRKARARFLDAEDDGSTKEPRPPCWPLVEPLAEDSEFYRIRKCQPGGRKA